MRRIRVVAALSAIAVLISHLPGAIAQPVRGPASITGFTRASASRHLKLESKVREAIRPLRIESALRHLTRDPHTAATAANNRLAEWVRDQWKEHGLEDVHFENYDVLLSYPKKVRLKMVAPREYEPTLREPAIPSDPDTKHSGIDLSFLAYSASGHITADVVYANSGNPADYDYLEGQGIDLRGKIAIVRYSVPYSYRGFKAYTAERRGLAGLIIYSDPKEDGFAKGAVYPDGPWGPEGHIQRGGIVYDFLYPGDPLTPGWPSIPGAKRLDRRDAAVLPRIPALPISWGEIKPILEAMGGAEAPAEWRGALPITYHLGPGPARVEMEVEMDEPVRPIINVLGRITGLKYPDEIVLLGNHRDAWVFGGHDPSSGTATMMEIARVLGGMAREGWRPKRTLMFASWDAEEYTLTGATEWGEEHADMLRKNLVTYLNVDSSASGSNFSAAAVPALAPLIEDALRAVRDPQTGKSVYERWKSEKSEAGTLPTATGGAKIATIGSGSDFTVFLHFLGAPSLDASFDGPYGVYHSAYDDFAWMSKYGDPGMRYSAALAAILSTIMLRLSNADVLPFDYAFTGAEVARYARALEKAGAAASEVAPVIAAAAELEAAGAWFNKRRDTLLAGAGARTYAARRISVVFAKANRDLISIERLFTHPDGLPGRTWYRHLLFGCRYTYAGMTLPGMTEALENHSEDQFRSQRGRVVEALKNAAAALRRCGEEIGRPKWKRR